ncbi:unnamed protein product [Paramecium sonneborni]|uniref:Transmembrane protein n=1 Tax=Paramecium sonneborni TaxID=65129 RepID=A0A8S1KVG3_9CILI|nr:unnamed protein product [Paramecium sonneborni]
MITLYYQIIQECIQKQVKLKQFQNLSDLSFQIKPYYYLKPLDQFQLNQALYLRKKQRQNEQINLVGLKSSFIIKLYLKNKPADNNYFFLNLSLCMCIQIVEIMIYLKNLFQARMLEKIVYSR